MTDSILFCTPCYGGMVTAPHFRSCLKLSRVLDETGLSHDWNVGWNESLVHRARMEMARVFLETDHSHLMWIDADIEFEPEHVAKLWNLGADIAVGVYRMKKPGDLYAAWKDGALVTDLSKFDGPTEVDFAGTGFMLIRRDVIETLTKKHGTYNGQHGPSPAIFMTPIHNGGLESEDYHFCRIARESGFKVVMDPSVRLVHWGQFGYGA